VEMVQDDDFTPATLHVIQHALPLALSIVASSVGVDLDRRTPANRPVRAHPFEGVDDIGIGGEFSDDEDHVEPRASPVHFADTRVKLHLKLLSDRRRRGYCTSEKDPLPQELPLYWRFSTEGVCRRLYWPSMSHPPLNVYPSSEPPLRVSALPRNCVAEERRTDGVFVGPHGAALLVGAAT
jgi:hypothetical protein